MTIKQLKEHVDKIERRIDRKLFNMRTYVDERISPFHDYLTKQSGYEAGLKDAELKSQIKSGDIRISKEAWWLIVKVVGFLGSVLGLIGWMINAK